MNTAVPHISPTFYTARIYIFLSFLKLPTIKPPQHSTPLAHISPYLCRHHRPSSPPNALHPSHLCLAIFVGIANPQAPVALSIACADFLSSVFILPFSLTSLYRSVPRSSAPLPTSVHRSLSLQAILAESANPLSHVLNYSHYSLILFFKDALLPYSAVQNGMNKQVMSDRTPFFLVRSCVV